jgi:Amt family ammonium transporter
MNVGLCVVCMMLIPLAAAGLALIHQGLGRSRSAAHSMLGTICALGIAAIVFVMVGWSLTGFPGGASHVLFAGTLRWNWLGAEPLLARGVNFGGAGAGGGLEMCLQMLAVGLAAMIPVSAGGDRWRLAGIAAASAVLAGLMYPLFAHWAWGGGWLAPRLTGGFSDAGGAGAVQVVGGFMALSVAWILGPRRGKYAADGLASAIPGHNIVQVLFGCLVALVGWIGLDAAVSMVYYGAGERMLAGIVVNAVLCASAGCLAAVALTRVRYRKPDASLSANGWIAGLVAGSAGAGFVTPVAAVIVGAVAGVLVTYMVEVFELRLMIDDPGGAVSVHAGAGMWGLLAVGIFGGGGSMLFQVVGVATLVGLMLPLIHVGNLLLNRLVPYRVDRDGDWQGMDVRELGAGAYPEFVVHADEFVPR